MENPTFQKEIPKIMESKEIPLWQKYTLAVEEASRYFRIGQAKLRRIINESEDADSGNTENAYSGLLSGNAGGQRGEWKHYFDP